MFKRNKKESSIDAIKVLDGERGSSNLDTLRKPMPAGAKTLLLLLGILASIICAAFILKAKQVKETDKENATAVQSGLLRNTLPKLKPVDTSTTKESAPFVSPVQAVKPMTAPVKPEPLKPEELLRERRLSSELIETKDRTGTSSLRSSEIASVPLSRSNSSNELQSKLEPLQLAPAAAGLIGDRNMLLTQGAMLDCQLETRITTDQPGMTSCYVTRDVYSTNGKVVLIDRGSKIVGNYQGGIKQGQSRIFVLWSRIETPTGVIINLDSPGTSALGEGGVGGIIDTHFWERFGGAVLISLIGDIGEYAAHQGQSNGSNSLQFNNTSQGTQQAVSDVLKNSINIPPTLYKNQGERVAVYVARDLDFGGVYVLKRSQ